MAPSLGEFGAELAAVDDEGLDPDTFLFHGHEFTLPERVSSLPALRFAYNAQQVAAAEEQALAKAQRARSEGAREAAARAMAEVHMLANAGLYQYLRDMLAEPEEWARFETVAAQHGADDAELLSVATQIMAAVAARPTRRSSGSPAGPPAIGAGSTDDSGPPTPVGVLPAGRYGGATPIAVPEAGTPDPADEAEEERDLSPLELARAEIRASSQPVTRRRRARSGG